MSFAHDLHQALQRLEAAGLAKVSTLERFRAEVEFASRLAAARPQQTKKWQQLILEAVDLVAKRLAASGAPDVEAAVAQAEALLAPLGKAAKEYTIHCVGHAHIDMNWLWPWAETVSVCHDTFSTMDKLMDEFPTFRFSQSQISVYEAMREYSPALFKRIKRRVAQGRWEVTASMWVEGSKNLASGEILCRHLLYSKRWLEKYLNLPGDSVKIDWECDTFGHAHTIPSLLRRGGVSRYYFHRCGVGHRLFWWQGKDGSRVLAYDDGAYGYNGRLDPRMTNLLFEFEKETGLKDMMFVHGVGDHGGGPTRAQLLKALEMDKWPVFPNVRFSTTDEFLSIAERQAKKLPVVDAELQYVFRGCYTSQSNIKRANRMAENALVEAEAAALIASRAVDFPYPLEALNGAWEKAMFNQFHDILPGSGVHPTYEYAQGLFQQVSATTGMVRTQSLRALAAQVNTASLAPKGAPAEAGPGIGGGAGEGAWWGGVSTLGAGAAEVEPFLVFNPSAWARREVVVTKIWNRNWPRHQIAVRDNEGNVTRAQAIGHGHYWGHDFITVAFPVDLPALGYRIYALYRDVEPPQPKEAWVSGENVLENEFLRVEVEPASGAIVHLVDKATGYDFVPEGGRLGLLQLLTEAPHGMTAWEIGQVVHQHDFVDGGILEVGQPGPQQASLVSRRKHNDSRLTLTISLNAGSRTVDFLLDADWLERGSPEAGVPMLKVAFPLALKGGKPTYEIPFGYVSREADGNEVPALRWADLSGLAVRGNVKVGATLVNDTKYGHDATENTLRLTLLRSSYDPDPLPELGEHHIRFAVAPHLGEWTASEATRHAADFNNPATAVATDLHQGAMPASQGFVSVTPENVVLSAIKRAEESEALILRLYEVDGKRTTAKVTLAPALVPGRARAVETDVLERPVEKSTAKMERNVLTVTLLPFGIVTVKIGK
jgi:alpha-mannosidase